MLEELIEKIKQGDVRSFEDFYFRTYDTLYSYAWILTGAHREKSQEMLIRTYCKVYARREKMPKESHVYAWLYRTMDQTAIEWLEMTEKKIQDIKREEENHETVVMLTGDTAASVLLSIEELLGFMEEQEETYGRKKRILSFFKFCFACVCFLLAVYAVGNGVGVLQNKIVLFNRLQNLLTADHVGESGKVGTDEEIEEKRIKIGDKLYYLSQVGEVLYSLPLAESDWDDKIPYNPEIQETEQWVYYLPCPERKGSKLANVSSKLVHTLYRMEKQDQSMEIVAEEVQDYYLYEGQIYAMQYGNIQKLGEEGDYQVLEDSLFAEARADGIYLFNVFGNALAVDTEQALQIEDRVYKMDGNRIKSVSVAKCRQGDVIWYLDNQDSNPEPGIYQEKDGAETLFESQGISIDSFCKVDHWIYYSAYMRDGGSGRNYSRIFRKPLSGGETELVAEEFPGRMTGMYYNEKNETIYGEYYPRSGDSGYGVIAAMGKDGILSVINDETEREARETTGHDDLSFVFVQDQDVLCYWNNNSWIRGEGSVAIWSEPLRIADQNRVPIR